MTLRKKLIRLAHANPDLRPHLLPILKDATPQTAINPATGRPWRWADYSPKDKQEMAEELWFNHRNEILDFVRGIIAGGQHLTTAIEQTTINWDKRGSFPGNQVYASPEFYKVVKSKIEWLWGKDKMLDPLARLIAYGDYVF